jgi:hypothetical protein
MKKITVLLSLIFVLSATGTANALVNEYYGQLRSLSEPVTILLLGFGLIWTASVARRF